MKTLISIILIISIVCLQSYAQTPQLVDDITTGTGSTTFTESIAYNGSLIFTAGSQLWISDGTSVGTQMLKNFPNNPNYGSIPAGFKSLNNKVYFVVNDSVHGRELWVTDGTVAGTQILIDINTNPTVGSIPVNYNDYYLTLMNGKLYFAANDGTHGAELWVSDGTAANTQMLKDINPTSGSSGINTSSILYGAIASTNGHILFAANDGVHGTELWITDGTAAGTTILKDIDTIDTLGSQPQYFIVFNDKVVFNAGGTFSGVYISDGTSNGTFQLNAATMSSLDHAILNNTFYFCTGSYLAGTLLWTSDGTAGGTQVVKDSILISAQIPDTHHYQIYLTAFNNKLYFGGRGLGAAQGKSRLWQSDGTPSGTYVLKTFATGSCPTELLSIGGNLYFRSYDTNRVNLWYFDGTDSNGIRQINYPGANSKIVFTVLVNRLLANPLTLVGNTLYFGNSYDSSVNIELYKLTINPNGVEFVSPKDNPLNIYPNPSSNILYVDGENIKYLSVYNICGNLQMSRKAGKDKINKLDISALSPGMYTIICLSEEGARQYGKFIKD